MEDTWDESAEGREITLRSYQVDLVKKCSESNSIIFLPTGSGKTCIAIFALKHFGNTFEGSLEDGGKRGLFLAPTKALVYQHARTLQEQTPFDVGAYTSESGVDFWPTSRWLNEFKNHQILVMTPAIMLSILTCNTINLSVFSIIIFDECHNGVNDQPFRGVMREMQNVCASERPRIIGLTATLLNRSVAMGKIADELEALEITYHGKIVTCSILDDVLHFSATPTIKIMPYEGFDQLVNGLSSVNDQCLTAAKKYSMIYEEMKKLSAPGGFQVVRTDSQDRVINRVIMDIIANIELFGLFAGALTALFFIIDFEQKRLLAANEVIQYLYGEFVSQLHQMRSIMMKNMGDDDSVKALLNFSSPQFLALLDELKTHDADCRSIIFVERRTSAIAITHMLNMLHKQDEKFKNIRPMFLIGGKGNPMNMQRLNLFELRRMERTLKQFNSGHYNTMVSTSVMEEGVDIPTCNRVYFLDAARIHYRSFIQAKGRTRDKTGVFVMLVAEAKLDAVKKTINSCLLTETELYRILTSGSRYRQVPSPESINESLYTEEVEPFFVDGPNSAHVNGVTAITCVTRYCSSLPQDKFSNLKPLLFIKKVQDKFSLAVQLPINSPVRHFISGEVMSSRKMAKRSAFVETVKVLYEAGELSHALLPKERATALQDYSSLFPHFKEETSNKDEVIYPGSKRRRQLYDLKHPVALTACLPSVGVPCYLHTVTFNPIYDKPKENINGVVYEMLKQFTTFAILSTKPLPEICEFPLYISAGEIRCKVVTSCSKVVLCENELKLIAKFHVEIFSLIECFPDFLILSQRNSENSFYIVPVNSSDNMEFEINWSIVTSVQDLLTEVTNDSFDDVGKTHAFAVISPSYRQSTDYYVVTKVLDDMSPLSQFPDSCTETFSSYFKNKYDEVVHNMGQPLLEVKKLPSTSNCFIRPRTSTSSGKKKMRKDLVTDDTFHEILIPELCKRFRFPSMLWLKLTLLPTALYRISELLLVEELHCRICTEAGVGNRPPSWAPLQPQIETVSKPKLNGSTFSPQKVNISVPAGAPLKEVNEPMDLLCNLDKVADCDIKYFTEFIAPSETKQSYLDIGGDNYRNSSIATPPANARLKLNIFNSPQSHGPELCELLATVTAKSVNDIVNLERLETLGDSFLKLATSLFLFMEFPKLNEGFVTTLKGKLVSNRNLLYCGVAKGIPALLQIHEFSPNGEWMPPSAELPEEIRDRLWSERINPGIVYSMNIPYEDRLKGAVDKSTLAKCHQIIDQTDAISEDQLMARSIVMFKKKVLNDKGIADCIEALIGAYILSFGLEGGLKILKWLDIIPAKGSYTNADNLLKIPAPSALLPNATLATVITTLNRNRAMQLEKLLNYQFKDKSYLLQALTHETCSMHNATDCYQRLEFLGDSVLDFLITCFIYQEVPHLDPGDITALRSALVNNTTFASQIVKFGIHRYLYAFSGPLADAIATFVSEQENRGHVVDEAVAVLLTENDWTIAEGAEVPKALGDLMESLAGAVFLDSGNSLETVWTVFYPLFKTELDSFSKQIPKNSISLLHELDVATFRNIVEVQPGVIRATVDLSLKSGESAIFYGFGSNKYNAKLSAAKLALHRYHNQDAS